MSFLFCQTLQFVIRHGNNSQDQIDEIKTSEENVEDKEENVVGPSRPQKDLVQILPKVLGHESKGRQVGKEEVVEAGVPIVGVWTKSLKIHGVSFIGGFTREDLAIIDNAIFENKLREKKKAKKRAQNVKVKY